MAAGPEEGTKSWSDAATRIPFELRALRLRFGADWAVVWGPLPIASTADYASVLFEDRDEARSSALGMAVPIVGNPWAQALFTDGGAMAEDAPTDPRLRLHDWVIRHNHVKCIASGAAIRDGIALAVVELYSQRPFTLPAEPIEEIRTVAARIAQLFPAMRTPGGGTTAAGAPVQDTLTAAALHDLKSALAAQSLLIGSFERELKAVASGANDPARMASMLEGLAVLRESVQHANDLTRVMTLGTLAPGSRASVDLPSLAKLSLAAIPLDLRDRFVVQTDPSVTLARPVGEAGTVLRVLVALVQNAALAIQRIEGARAFMRVRSEETSGVVEIEDEGPGIPAEIASRVFEPGVTTRDPSDGHGYSLSSARDAVTALGGSLTLYSIPRHGARFTVRLPRDIAGL